MSLFLFEHLEEVGTRLQAAGSLALFLDFDGTLAPFDENPDRVVLPRSLKRIVGDLSAREKWIVGIVSGRERADLQQRVGLPGLVYAGNHGLEISGPGFIFIEPTAVGYREPLHTLANDLVARLSAIEGTWVEDKGLTVSVHWRQAVPNHAEEIRHIVHSALENASHPFLLTTGNRVYDIRPRVYWHKGAAVNWILEKVGKQSALTMYVGDDATDEDAFTALPDGITVRVGEAAESTAAYYVNGPEEVERLLEWLTIRLS